MLQRGSKDFSFVPSVLFSVYSLLFLLSSSVSLSYFILAVPMRKCMGKHSCLSSPLFFSLCVSNENWEQSSVTCICISHVSISIFPDATLLEIIHVERVDLITFSLIIRSYGQML